MRTISLTFSLMLSVAAASAQEPVVKSKIVAAGLFKNGLAVIKREVVLPGPGTYRLDNLPEPVHGTWWIESQAAVETKVKTKEVDVPVGANIHLQDDLAGKLVTVHFKDGKTTPMTGTVLKINSLKDETVVSEDGGVDSAREAAASGRFLVLKTSKGRVYIDVPNISIVEAEGTDELVRKERRPVLLLAAPKARKDEKVLISYLTHGLGWAASYRVDISDPKTLAIELSALVKNELTKLEDTDLRLISGFPSVQFAHVRSPLSPMQSWASFFQQLQSGPGRQHELVSQAIMSNSITFNRPTFGLDAGATPQGEGVDLHFQPIGKRTLAKGEALSLSIATEKAPYERVIEWLIPDNRDEHGRYRTRDLENEEAWDALRFKNPFSFPMTTGPAMVTAQGQFNGQRTSYYVNTGEETMLRITKALSIRTRQTEQEVVGKDGERDFVYVGGNRYQKSTVAAELLVANHRKEDIKIIIRRRFSGDLVTAEGAPQTSLREEGVYSVNKRNEMIWVLPLKGGEERRLSYRYHVLVAH